MLLLLLKFKRLLIRFGLFATQYSRFKWKPPLLLFFILCIPFSSFSHLTHRLGNNRYGLRQQHLVYRLQVQVGHLFQQKPLQRCFSYVIGVDSDGSGYNYSEDIDGSR